MQTAKEEPMDELPALSGKTILITGATSGIGKVSARELARMGARVVIVGRNPQKIQATTAEILAATGVQVESMQADLSLMSEVQRLAEEFLQRYDQLDVLVNNAGAYFTKYETTAEGYEHTIALNYLSPWLLTHYLLDCLKASAPARIINVSSSAHIFKEVDFKDLQYKKGFVAWLAYSQSKLMDLYFTYELARRLNGTEVTVNALHPGFVDTNFGKNGGITGFFFKWLKKMQISPEKGAETIIYLASSSDVAAVSGKYFVEKKAVKSSIASRNPKTASRLWEATEDLLQVED
jgi:NAD(P)-dependent dehydrogenase (short-subunit alcohol dehydrogenase family)